ncbi:HAMP domain-containing sensor histidine kinase [Pseudomonas neustonica]|uniref:HAMP domain-containing sensor histidine kinase n=1 Tax=Pseudomonas neustonica TaxID=2487346 RepID=UPI003F4835A4|tara:strand:- start:17510 stop:18838 length:1329 start_codon:yes stop_codon:yes gene_type:complete
MRLFWKVFAVLWLATLLVGGSGFLVSRALQQDWLLLQLNPPLRDFAAQLTSRYEQQGAAAAQAWLELQRRQHQISARLFDSNGQSLLAGTLRRGPRINPNDEARPRRSMPPPPRSRGRMLQLSWQTDQDDYLLAVHIAEPGLWNSERAPIRLLLNIALGMSLLALLSLLLSRYLTAPLRELGLAAQSLGRGQFQAKTLDRVNQRKDEIGDLSRQFGHMAGQVQTLLESQQQLMRDISHELRSPLARLRVGLALGSQRQINADAALWQRLDLECDRLDRLIDAILSLSRLDSPAEPAQSFALDPLLAQVVEDAQFASPDLQITLEGKSDLRLSGWPDQLASAFDNLLRNAQRFSPQGGSISVRVKQAGPQWQISVEDQGPGVPEPWLNKLSEAFVRLPGQPPDTGYGLGLTIAARAIARHQGRLAFTSVEGSGLKAVVELPQH